MNEELMKDDLTAEQEHVLKNKGTEAPGTGALLNEKGEGMFKCAACGQQLFESGTKFESGSGWPSFDSAIVGSTKEVPDESGGMTRTEVVCSKCGGHLGHVFDDGPKETTGKRFCVNSCSLDFEDKDGNTKSGAGNKG